MTRKEELRERALRFMADEHSEPSDLVELLEQVEREVWGKAIAILDGGRFLSDSSMERIWADSVIKVLRQQQELG